MTGKTIHPSMKLRRFNPRFQEDGDAAHRNRNTGVEASCYFTGEEEVHSQGD